MHSILNSLLLFLGLLAVSVAEVTSSAELILEGYDQTIPPIGLGNNTDEALKIDYDINFVSIKNIIEKEAHIILNFFEYMSWYDERLRY
jgi:hypothetical protein